MNDEASPAIPPTVDPSAVQRVGPEEAELRQQWADATSLAWYAESAAQRKDAQTEADRLWDVLLARRSAE